MTPALDRRLVTASAAALPPFAFIGAGLSPAPPVLAIVAVAAVSAGLVRLEASLRERGEAAVSVPAAIAVLYGTGLFWYEVVEPGPAAVGFLLATLLVGVWLRRRGGGLGLAVARGAGLGTVLAALALTVERFSGGTTRWALGRPAVLESLFSSRHGVLFWTPLLTLAVLGLIARALRGRAEAAGALAGLTVFAALNAALRPWWGGGLGNARFLCALPLFAFGLAAVLQAIHTAARRQPLALPTVAGAVLVAWNLLLMAQYRRDLVPRDDTVAFAVLVQNGAGLVASAVGAPVAWPANWLFAIQEELPAARYDLLAGQDVLASGPVRLALGEAEASAAILGEGWSVRHPCGNAVCREIEGGRARLFLPVVDPRPAEWRVRAAGSGTLRVALNGTALAEAALSDAMTDVGAIVGRERVRRGVNELLLETGGGHASVEAVSVAPQGDAR